MKQLTTLIKFPLMIAMSMGFFVLTVLIVIFENDGSICYTCIPEYVCAACYAETAFRLPIDPIAQMLATVMGMSVTLYAAALVNEDRTTGNLKFMSMAEVNPWQYLAGSFVSISIIASAIVVPFAVLGFIFEGMNPLWFAIVGLSGSLVATLLGTTIGLHGNPLLSIVVPMGIGFLPMLSNVNEAVANLSRFVFVIQVNVAIADLEADLTESFIIIAANGAVAFLWFVLIHRKNRLRV